MFGPVPTSLVSASVYQTYPGDNRKAEYVDPFGDNLYIMNLGSYLRAHQIPGSN
jgi:hypothetical protein